MRRLAFSLLLLSVAAWAQSRPSSLQITVRHLNLMGATQISPADRLQISSDIEKRKYTEDSVSEISDRLCYALQERGFFKASAATPEVTVVSSNPTEQIIDVTYQVHEGQRYRLKQITFRNVQPTKGFVFSEKELRQAFQINDGEIFEPDKIRVGLEQLRKVYASKGYVNFTPVPNTEADDRMGAIALRIDVDEGLAFRVGDLVLDGIEPVPGAGAKLLESWKQYEGRVYDGGQVLKDFIRENAAYLPSHPTEQKFDIQQDPEHHILVFRLELDDPTAEK